MRRSTSGSFWRSSSACFCTARSRSSLGAQFFLKAAPFCRLRSCSARSCSLRFKSVSFFGGQLCKSRAVLLGARILRFSGSCPRFGGFQLRFGIGLGFLALLKLQCTGVLLLCERQCFFRGGERFFRSVRILIESASVCTASASAVSAPCFSSSDFSFVSHVSRFAYSFFAARKFHRDALP